MIPTLAVRGFLERKLDDHLWIKRLTHAQLDAELQQLTPRPTLSPRIRLHQKACFLLGVCYPQFCFWLDMGCGKSMLSLELLRYWWQCGLIRRAVIFITSDKAFSTWQRQLKEFDIGLPMLSLSGSSAERWKKLEEFQEGLVLLPYPGAVAMTTKRVAAKKKGKQKLKLDDKLIRALGAWTQAFVLDESTRCGSRDSLTYKLVSKLRRYAWVRYALAGRPFGRDPTMLWSQHFLIDDGETLGETLGLYRAAFFSESDNYWDPRGFSKNYKFKKKMEPQLSQMVQHRSITYTASECVQLPKVIPVKEFVAFPQEAQAYYEWAYEELVKARGNFRETKNAFLRMRQISSGFVGVKNDETGETAEIEFGQNPKLDRLLELIEEMPEDRKAVVFYAFTVSGRKISEELRQRGIQNIWLWAGSKYKFDPVTEFQDNPKYRIMVIQNQIGAMSLDGLQKVANYQLFYESPVGVIDREQAEKRIERDGQPLPVFRYDLGVRGTVDDRILEFHQEGRDLFAAVLKNPAQLKLFR